MSHKFARLPNVKQHCIWLQLASDCAALRSELLLPGAVAEVTTACTHCDTTGEVPETFPHSLPAPPAFSSPSMLRLAPSAAAAPSATGQGPS